MSIDISKNHFFSIIASLSLPNCSVSPLNQSLAGGPDCRLGPVVHTQLVEDVNHVAFYGVMADDEYLRNLKVGKALCQKTKHLKFSAGKAHPDTIILSLPFP